MRIWIQLGPRLRIRIQEGQKNCLKNLKEETLCFKNWKYGNMENEGDIGQPR